MFYPVIFHLVVDDNKGLGKNKTNCSFLVVWSLLLVPYSSVSQNSKKKKNPQQ